MGQIDQGKSAGRLVHELGNLLAIVVGHAEYLLHEADPPDRKECLEAIRRAAVSARETARELHRFHKAAEAGTTATPPAGPATRRARVLVIDDQDDVRDTMAVLLGQLGHEVETAATGAEGIDRYRQRRFDCVLTDLAMPGLSGLTVSRAIKDHDPEAYVVLLTGVDHEGEPGELEAAGVDRVAVKPLTRREMVEVVERGRA